MAQGANSWIIILTLAALVWLGLWIDTRPLRKYLPGPVVVLIGSCLVSNAGIIPLESSLYRSITAYLVPLAIPLLLFKANLRTLYRDTGGVLFVFVFAAMASIFGACVAYALTDFGDEAGKIAGVFAGVWIGGIVNMVAVSQAVELSEAMFTVAVAVTSPLTVLTLLTLMTLPTLQIVRRFCRSEDLAPLKTDSRKELAPDQQQPPPFQPTHLVGAVVVSLSLCVLSKALAHALGVDKFAILIITFFTVVAVNVRPSFFASLRGSFELGMVFMYTFFAAIGASTDLTVFRDNASTMTLFGAIVVASHIALMLVLARVFRLRLEEVVVSSSAAIAGPAAAAAIASARGWRPLVTPGLLCGVFGYVIANFVGVFIATLLP